ncbi:AAA family ATPase [Acetatifactor aquisgranensis]|uniref:AAA family ATPase n=1 Tax=Acetatifactor aquisgranensis TaxID=2941233 RepID=UPI00203E7845|nr:AAA family ATPase [Acetatifactor aquisgranensis]
MIINKLEMYNFRQYIGLQEVEFSTDSERNVTVLIGVNTSGKTTIIRAFEWCLYGKNGFEDMVLLNSEVRENMNMDDIQETWVAVTFIHDEKVYTIKRTHRYVCMERHVENGKIMVELGKKPQEDVILEYLQKDGQTKSEIDRSNIEESMNRVLPRDLSDYFFFGGERISGIANRTDLSKAVRGLMRLDVLENAYTHLRTVVKEFEGDIDTTGDTNAQKAKDGLETYTKRKTELEEELKNYYEQVAYWLEEEKLFDAQLAKSNIEQVKELADRRRRVQSALEGEVKKLERIKQDIVQLFNNRTFAYFGLPSIKASLEFLEKQNAKAGGVRESIPAMEQDAIDYLIKRGTCICGTPLKPGTPPFMRVMEERRVLPPEHVGDAVRQYKDKSEGYLAGTEDYKDNIERKFIEYRETKRQIGQLQNELEALAGKVIDDSEARRIENNRKNAHIKYSEAKQDYDLCNRKLGECQSNIENCRKAIDKFANSSKRNQRTARLIAYAQRVYEWLLDTYREKEDIVRIELQKRVNENFSKMYHGERAIEIDDKYRVKYSDITTEESDGLKAVKSFAFIASLVSMAKDRILDEDDMKLGQVYPVVMDAPFSNVDEIHIDNICKILPKTANQVIMAVMQKDWEYASGNLQGYVGKSYKIEKDRDVYGKEIDTVTHIV